jgi:hypothetical protein
VGVRICPGRHTTVLGGIWPTAPSQNALAEMRTPQPHTICMALMKIPSFYRGVVTAILTSPSPRRRLRAVCYLLPATQHDNLSPLHHLELQTQDLNHSKVEHARLLVASTHGLVAAVSNGLVAIGMRYIKEKCVTAKVSSSCGYALVRGRRRIATTAKPGLRESHVP